MTDHQPPAEGSTERAAWDQLTTAERDTVTAWRSATLSNPVELPGDRTRRALCLAALGYNTHGHLHYLNGLMAAPGPNS